jgi:hypothetical protein
LNAPNISRWIGIGLLGLPLYGALTFWSSLDPQPDPNTHYEAFSRFVTTDHYVLSHLFGSILGLVFAIFGTFALGAYLTNGRAGRLGLVAMVVTVLGSALFLPAMGVSTFATPEEGQAYLAGIEEFAKLPDMFADTVFALTSLVVIILLFVGNVLLGIAVWRSGTLPRWAGALWAPGDRRVRINPLPHGRGLHQQCHRLYLSPKTVRNYVSSIFTKLHVSDT